MNPKQLAMQFNGVCVCEVLNPCWACMATTSGNGDNDDDK